MLAAAAPPHQGAAPPIVMGMGQWRRFGKFEFSPDTLELRRNGLPLPLRPQPGRALRLLTETPGEVVTRQRFRAELWGDTVVSYEKSLTFCILQLRRALDDDAARPHYVETVPRIGYRFVAPIEPSPVRTHVATDARRRAHPPRGAWIASALTIAWLAGATGQSKQTIDASAREDYSRARYLLDQKRDDRSLRLASEYLDSVLEAEPEWAEAWVALGRARMRTRPADRESARAAFERAVELAPDLATAHLRLGDFRSLVDWDWNGSGSAYARAIALDPTLTTAHQHLASLRSLTGDAQGAVEAIEIALTLDPVGAAVHGDAGWMYWRAGQFGRALDVCRRTLELEPQHRHALECVVHVQLELGRTQDARATAWTALAAAGAARPADGDTVRAYYEWRIASTASDPERHRLDRALSYAALGRDQAAVDELTTACDHRDWRLPLWVRDPRFDSLRRNVGFRRVLARLGLSDGSIA